MKPVIAILIEYGFHEVKKYIHSGFYKKLSVEFDIVWFVIDKKNETLNEYFESTGFPVVYLNFDTDTKPLLKIETINLAVRKAWMRNQGIRLHHYYKQQRGPKRRDKLMGMGFIKMMIENTIFGSLRKYYHSKELEKLFGKHHVANVLTTSYRSAYSKEFIYTAQNLHYKSWFLVNSWKDLYLGNFLPNNLTGLFVWSDDMKEQYLKHMPYLQADTVYVTGNPTFDYMLFSDLTHSRAYYAKKYSIPEEADWIYYTMLPPGNVNDEIEIVKLVANKILEQYSSKEKVILLRRNPNHDMSDFTNIDLPDNVVLTDHYCTYDKKTDMILQSREGEIEWFDLVNYVSMDISVPSTVTLEFLLRNKPVLNIGFGPDGGKDARLDQYLHSEFYAPLFKRKDVVLCASPNELILKMKILENEMPESKKNMLFPLAEEGFSSAIVDILKKCNKSSIKNT